VIIQGRYTQEIMASQNQEKISIELDIKYKMKRPSYDVEDLETLKRYFSKELNRNPEWKDFWIEEETMIRFLKANESVQESLEALETYCDWRHKFDVDNISPDDSDIQKESSARREEILDDERDYCGRPVIIMYPRLHDMYHGDYPSLYKYVTFQMEQLTSICDQVGEDGTFCLVVDMKSFAMKNMDYTALRKIFWILKNCYPERLGVCLIINYPWVFYGCWEVIKLWLNDVTRSKIHFCTKKELSDFLDIRSCHIEILK